MWPFKTKKKETPLPPKPEPKTKATVGFVYRSWHDEYHTEMSSITFKGRMFLLDGTWCERSAKDEALKWLNLYDLTALDSMIKVSENPSEFIRVRRIIRITISEG